MTRAMLLCAGLSTRLGDLGDKRPKPLLPVCNVPILHYGIANLVAHGIRDIVINLHHHGDLIRQELGDGADLGASIQYSMEEEILGTGGGLKKALPLLDPSGTDEPFISMNGKLIFDLDITALLAAYRADRDILGMMVVRKVPDAMTWGAVDVDETGPLRVKNVLGEGQYMFCGVHVTRPSVMARLPDGPACSIRQGYLPWMHAGEAVGAFAVGDGYFAEHSIPERYLQSNLDLLSGAPLAHPPGVLVGIDPSATVDPSAEIIEPVRIGPGALVEAGAKVGPCAVVGTGARVTGGASLSHSVAWPGVTVTGPHDHAVLTD